VNLGISANFNKVFGLAKGKYFKWSAHDDEYLPDYLRQCVTVLDTNKDVVLCYSKTIEIDAQGNRVRELNSVPGLSELALHRRFRAALGLTELPQLWGLSRTEVMRETPLIGNYVAPDGPYLSNLTLLGRFYEIPEGLFLHREHENRAGLVFSWREPHKSIIVYDPSQVGKTIFPEWRLLSEHVAGVWRARPSLIESLWCYLEIIKWMRPRKRMLLRDLLFAGRKIYGIGLLFDKIYERYFNPRTVWANNVSQLETDIRSVIPVGDEIILVDEAELGNDVLAEWRTIPFLEYDGTYWGLPPDDKTAIDELERLRQSGTSYIAFAWPCFWWFEHYTGFIDYLRSKFECKLKNNRIVIYDLHTYK
jgi:hypothetical protein